MPEHSPQEPAAGHAPRGLPPAGLSADALFAARLEPGSVALVGGGPGALDLITVRGLALLRQADVVVVDRLGPVGLTDLIGEHVEVIGVGKKPGHPSLRQEQIQEILVAQARAGRRVVRLKGGDPFVLGRGGEEVLACRAAGVPVQVVPGVTSAIAGPAAGDVPVTHRGTAVATHIVNAHGDLGPADLAALADPGTTTVLMMGVEWLPRLVAQALLNGIDEQTPVAVVQEATMPGQRVVRGTLRTIEQMVREAGIGFPAVIVVGRTAAEGFLVPPEAHAAVRGSGREAVQADDGSHGAGEASDKDGHASEDDSAPRSPVLIGCAHGTRARGGRDVMRELLMAIRAAAPDIPVREAYVDVQQPEIADAVEAVTRPVPEARTREADEVDAVVVPLLLSTGYHVRHDIGEAVRGRRAVACGPLGPDPRLAAVMAQRLREAGASTGADGEHAVVMAAAGTSDPAGQEMVERMAALLSAELGCPVRVGYVSAARPRVAEAVAQVREETGRPVAIASYLLIPGHFQIALEHAGADVIAEPLGAHPLVVDLAIERYRAAVGE